MIGIIKKNFFALKKEIASLINQEKANKRSHLQNYLYFINYPLFSFAESVIILCENGKYQSAKVLLRSLFEAHINIIYHQLADSKHRLALSAKAGFDTKMKYVRELKDFIRRYPNLKSTDSISLFSDEWLQQTEKWIEGKRQAILKGNNLQETDQDPDLKSKAIKCDQTFINNVEKGYFEQMYHLIFRQLSLITHLNIEGLETFVNQREREEYLFNDGNDDSNFLITEAVEICVAFAKDLYECGVIKGEITKMVPRIEKLITEMQGAKN